MGFWGDDDDVGDNGSDFLKASNMAAKKDVGSPRQKAGHPGANMTKSTKGRGMFAQTCADDEDDMFGEFGITGMDDDLDGLEPAMTQKPAKKAATASGSVSDWNPSLLKDSVQQGSVVPDVADDVLGPAPACATIPEPQAPEAKGSGLVVPEGAGDMPCDQLQQQEEQLQGQLEGEAVGDSAEAQPVSDPMRNSQAAVGPLAGTVLQSGGDDCSRDCATHPARAPLAPNPDPTEAPVHTDQHLRQVPHCTASHGPNLPSSPPMEPLPTRSMMLVAPVTAHEPAASDGTGGPAGLSAADPEGPAAAEPQLAVSSATSPNQPAVVMGEIEQPAACLPPAAPAPAASGPDQSGTGAVACKVAPAGASGAEPAAQGNELVAASEIHPMPSAATAVTEGTPAPAPAPAAVVPAGAEVDTHAGLAAASPKSTCTAHPAKATPNQPEATPAPAPSSAAALQADKTAVAAAAEPLVPVAVSAASAVTRPTGSSQLKASDSVVLPVGVATQLPVLRSSAGSPVPTAAAAADAAAEDRPCPGGSPSSMVAAAARTTGRASTANGSTAVAAASSDTDASHPYEDSKCEAAAPAASKQISTAQQPPAVDFAGGGGAAGVPAAPAGMMKLTQGGAKRLHTRAPVVTAIVADEPHMRPESTAGQAGNIGQATVAAAATATAGPQSKIEPAAAEAPVFTAASGGLASAFKGTAAMGGVRPAVVVGGTQAPVKGSFLARIAPAGITNKPSAFAPASASATGKGSGSAAVGPVVGGGTTALSSLAAAAGNSTALKGTKGTSSAAAGPYPAQLSRSLPQAQQHSTFLASSLPAIAGPASGGRRFLAVPGVAAGSAGGNGSGGGLFKRPGGSLQQPKAKLHKPIHTAPAPPAAAAATPPAEEQPKAAVATNSAEVAAAAQEQSSISAGAAGAGPSKPCGASADHLLGSHALTAVAGAAPRDSSAQTITVLGNSSSSSSIKKAPVMQDPLSKASPAAVAMSAPTAVATPTLADQQVDLTAQPEAAVARAEALLQQPGTTSCGLVSVLGPATGSCSMRDKLSSTLPPPASKVLQEPLNRLEELRIASQALGENVRDLRVKVAIQTARTTRLYNPMLEARIRRLGDRILRTAAEMGIPDRKQ